MALAKTCATPDMSSNELYITPLSPRAWAADIRG